MSETRRRPYCGGSAERIGVPCHFCEPTRLEHHEATCRGLRDWWHVLTGEHVRLARWDSAEATFMVIRSKARVERWIAYFTRIQAHRDAAR